MANSGYEFLRKENIFGGFPRASNSLSKSKQLPFKRFGQRTIRSDKKKLDAWIDSHCHKRCSTG